MGRLEFISPFLRLSKINLSGPVSWTHTRVHRNKSHHKCWPARLTRSMLKITCVLTPIANIQNNSEVSSTVALRYSESACLVMSKTCAVSLYTHTCGCLKYFKSFLIRVSSYNATLHSTAAQILL